MKIKILIAYHKLDWILKDEIYTPIHVGRAIFHQKSKDGIIKKEDEDKILSLMIGDDTGENISKENRFFNEMTALYWAWKNYEKLGNPDYIGLEHYRRHFIFNYKLKLPDRTWLPNCKVYCFNCVDSDYKKYIDTRYLYEILNNYDTVASYQYDTREQNKSKIYNNLRDRYIELTGLNGDLYDVMIKYILYNFPEYKIDVDIFNRSTSHYLFNMFIMKKELFKEYGDFVFNCLFEIKRNMDITKLNFTQMRAPGFLAEFLTSIFINHMNRIGKMHTLSLPISFIENIQKEETIKGYIKNYDKNLLKKYAMKIAHFFNSKKYDKNNYKTLVDSILTAELFFDKYKSIKQIYKKIRSSNSYKRVFFGFEILEKKFSKNSEILYLFKIPIYTRKYDVYIVSKQIFFIKWKSIDYVKLLIDINNRLNKKIDFIYDKLRNK